MRSGNVVILTFDYIYMRFHVDLLKGAAGRFALVPSTCLYARVFEYHSMIAGLGELRA